MDAWLKKAHFPESSPAPNHRCSWRQREGEPHGSPKRAAEIGVKKANFPLSSLLNPRIVWGLGLLFIPAAAGMGWMGREVAGAGGRPGAAAPRCFSGSSPYLRRVPTVTLGTLKDEHGGRISAFLPRPRRRRQDGGCRPSQERAVAVLSPRFPQIIGKTLGFPQNAAGRVCARRVFCSAPRTDTFSPAFRLPPPWRMGIFGRAPSHPRQRGQPRGRGDGSSLAVAANIHGFSCQSPSPCRAAAPGSMKARVVRARAGASRTQALLAPSPRPQS